MSKYITSALTATVIILIAYGVWTVGISFALLKVTVLNPFDYVSGRGAIFGFFVLLMWVLVSGKSAEEERRRKQGEKFGN